MTEKEITQEIIVCRDVHKWFDSFHVLKGINLTIQKGEVIVVFGPSGSGKSTFIRCINRLEEHQKGQIIVDGTELRRFTLPLISADYILGVSKW